MARSNANVRDFLPKDISPAVAAKLEAALRRVLGTRLSDAGLAASLKERLKARCAPIDRWWTLRDNYTTDAKARHELDGILDQIVRGAEAEWTRKHTPPDKRDSDDRQDKITEGSGHRGQTFHNLIPKDSKWKKKPKPNPPEEFKGGSMGNAK